VSNVALESIDLRANSRLLPNARLLCKLDRTSNRQRSTSATAALLPSQWARRVVETARSGRSRVPAF